MYYVYKYMYISCIYLVAHLSQHLDTFLTPMRMITSKIIRRISLDIHISRLMIYLATADTVLANNLVQLLICHFLNILHSFVLRVAVLKYADVHHICMYICMGVYWLFSKLIIIIITINKINTINKIDER